VLGFTVKTEERPKYETAEVLRVDYAQVYQATNIYTKPEGQAFEINKSKDHDNFVLKLKTNLPGIYNVYNVLAAAVVGSQRFGNKVLGPIEEFRPVFGRGERVQLNQVDLRLFLIKNPAGFDQVLEYLHQIYGGGELNLVTLINDKIADGTDVSWLWDVDLEKFIRNQKLGLIKTSGTRGLDMLLRLEYAGAQVQPTDFFANTSGLVDYLREQTGEIVILSTYTATLALREELGKHVKLTDISEKGN
jgi:UDP-N-acetylmuramyl tripeptide synthase